MKYITATTRCYHDTGELAYIAFHPEWTNELGLNPCTAQGDTPAEARVNLVEVLDMCIDHCREFNLPIPEPFPPGTPLWVDFNHMTGGRL